MAWKLFTTEFPVWVPYVHNTLWKFFLPCSYLAEIIHCFYNKENNQKAFRIKKELIFFPHPHLCPTTRLCPTTHTHTYLLSLFSFLLLNKRIFKFKPFLKWLCSHPWRCSSLFPFSTLFFQIVHMVWKEHTVSFLYWWIVFSCIHLSLRPANAIWVSKILIFANPFVSWV